MSEEIQEKSNEFSELIKRMEDEQITRRQFVTRAAAVGIGMTTIGAALAACASDKETTTTAGGTETTAGGTETTAGSIKGATLNVMAQGVMLADTIVKKCEEDTGLILNTTATTEPDMLTRMVTGGAKQYDVVQGATCYLEPMWNAGVLMPIPLEKVPNCKKLRPQFTDPTALGTGDDNYPINVSWLDPDEQTTFKMVPALWNMEGWGYLSEKCPELNQSSDLPYSTMWDPKYKGHVGIWNDSVWAPGWTAMAMEALGMMTLSGSPSKLTTDEIDQVMAHLTDLRQAGQYRTYWSDYGEIVNLMSSGEVWCADCWNPIASAVNQVTPCTFVNPTEGARGWMHGLVVSKECQNPDAAFAYIDWCMNGWRMAQIAPMGLYETTDGNVLGYMTTEDYAFWYEGEGRDVGSMEHRLPKINAWVEYPANPEYQLSKWLNFLAS